MTTRLTYSTAALVGAVLASPMATGQIVLDGTADAGYGAALSVQDTDTGFGNSLVDDLAIGSGSEISQFFATIDNDTLYFVVAGNLETNFNKLELFFDTGDANGVNTLVGSALPAAVDPFCCGGLGTSDGALQRMDGLTFDAGFNASHYLTFSHGVENAVGTSFYAGSAHFADLTNGASGDNVAVGLNFAAQGLPEVLRTSGDGLADAPTVPDPDFGETTAQLLANGNALPSLGQGELVDQVYAFGPGGATDNSGAGLIAPELEFALPVDTVNDPTNSLSHRDFENTIGLKLAVDNSNIEGLNGDGTVDGSDNPQDVVTGIEFALPLAALGNPTGDIKITAFINGTGHDFASNQFIGDGVLAGNLGGDGSGGFTGDFSGVNLSTIGGDQFVTVAGAAVLGDLNGDGKVDGNDFGIFAGNFGINDGSATPEQGDLNGDGNIDGNDFGIFAGVFGTGTSATAAVPEPASLALLSLGGLLALRRRRSA